jgi:hypothetical protein
VRVGVPTKEEMEKRKREKREEERRRCEEI